LELQLIVFFDRLPKMESKYRFGIFRVSVCDAVPAEQAQSRFELQKDICNNRPQNSALCASHAVDSGTLKGCENVRLFLAVNQTSEEGSSISVYCTITTKGSLFLEFLLTEMTEKFPATGAGSYVLT
jgi:hypothetical protein